MDDATMQLTLATETQPFGLTLLENPDPFQVKAPCREEPDFNELVTDLIMKEPERYDGFAHAYPLTEADGIFYTGIATIRAAKEMQAQREPIKGGILEILAPSGADD